MLTNAAIDFLEERGIDLELALKFEPESRPPPGGNSDGEWLAFPFLRNDRPVNREYRRIDQKQFRRDTGGVMCFWNEVVIDDVGLQDYPLVITEGILDAISVIQAGYPRTMSMPNGSQSSENASPEQTQGRYRFIADVLQKMDRARQVIICADADAKGYALIEDLATMLGPARCKFVPFPDHCKDANDVLVRFGAERLRECVSKARWVNVAGVRRFSDYPPGSDADPIVWRSGISPAVDKRIGIMPGYSSVWTGVPNNGKSTLLNQIKWSLCENQPDFRVAMAMLEIMPNRDYRRQALQYRIGRPRDGGPNGQPWTREEIDAANNWLEDHVIPIDPNGYASGNGDYELEDVEPTIDWFLDAATTAIVRHGVKFVALDPWGELIQTRERGESEHDFIGRSLSRINRLARTLKAHIAIVAHPRKIEPGRGGAIRPPGPYEIAGSSYFFNKTSLGVTVHRDPERDEDGDPKPGCTRTLCAVWKSKFHDVQGAPGQIYLRYAPNKMRFECAS